MTTMQRPWPVRGRAGPSPRRPAAPRLAPFALAEVVSLLRPPCLPRPVFLVCKRLAATPALPPRSCANTQPLPREPSPQVETHKHTRLQCSPVFPGGHPSARPAPGIRPGPRPQNSPSLGEPAFHASFSANVFLPPGISSQTPSYTSRWVGGEGAGPADPGQELTSRSGTWEETTLPLQEYEGTSCQGKPPNHFPFLARPQPLPRARSHFPPRAPACAFPLGVGPSLGWSSLWDSPLPGRTVLPAGQP